MPDISIGRLRGGFCVYWTEDGKRKRYQLGARTRKEAEAEAVTVFRQKTSERPAETVASIWMGFREEHKGRTIAANMEWSGRSILPFFGALQVSSVSKEHCDKYIAMRRREKRKDGTIRTELGHLRIALRWAEKMKMIDAAPHIWKPSKPIPRERWLTKAEMEAMADNAKEPHIRLAIMLLASTGARIGAILGLTWDRVDFDRSRIILQLPGDFRQKRRANPPMTHSLREEMLFAKECALSDYVIEWGGKPVKSIKKGFKAAAERSGIENVTPHDLRRSVARILAESGMPIAEIAQFLGHTDTNTTFEVYARFSPDHLREAAEVLNFMDESKVRRTKGKSA